MSTSIYTASASVFERVLGGLVACMDKAAGYAEERKFGVDVLLTSRLSPDMLSFDKQVQIACDTAKFAVGRLTGSEAPKFDDSEKTMAELRDRVMRTVAYVKSVPASKFEGAAMRDVELPRRGAEPRRFKGEDYLNSFALPNFYFHVTTAYALMRHNGVPLGKLDFLHLA
jgi:hypothetical protein